MPQGNYEVSILFQTDGASDVGFTLPVGEQSVSVLWEQNSSGLFFVNGSVQWFAREKLAMLSSDRGRHVLYAKVLTRDDQAGVLVCVDGVEIGRWEGAAVDLNPVTSFRSSDPKLPTLNLWSGRVAFYSASLHMLSGTVERVEVDESKAALASANGAGPGGARLVGAGRQASSEMPADGSRPKDAKLNGDYLYHDLVTVTFSKSNDGSSLEKIESRCSDRRGALHHPRAAELRGQPRLHHDPHRRPRIPASGGVVEANPARLHR